MKYISNLKEFFLNKINILRKYKLLNFIFLVIENIINFEIMSISGEAAYYFILSFFPFLFLLILLVPFLPINFSPLLFFIQENIPSYLQPIFGANFNTFFENAHTSTISLSIIILIFSSSSATSLVIKKLNLIYKSELTRGTILDRVWSIIINLILIIIIFSFAVFALSIDDILTLISNIFKIELSASLNVIKFLIIPIFILVTVLLINYFSVPKRMKIKDIYIGSIFTAVVLIGALFSFNFYLSHFNHYAIYGFIGAFIILLLYFYMIAFIMLTGAIINRVIMDLK